MSSKIETERQKQIFEIVQRIIVEQGIAPEEKITRESKFVEDLACDSLDTVELVMECEDAFAVSIPDEQAEEFSTVGDVVTWLDENGAQF